MIRNLNELCLTSKAPVAYEYHPDGLAHGEKNAERFFRECHGTDDATQEGWWAAYSDRVQWEASAMYAAGVTAAECRSFATASWRRIETLTGVVPNVALFR